MQSLVLSYSQRQYTKAARAGVEAANLALKDAAEQVALDASTAYIELDYCQSPNSPQPTSRSRSPPTCVRIEAAARRGRRRLHISTCCRPDSKPPRSSSKPAHLETRAATLAKQLAVLTGLPVGLHPP